jgi:hypothetical protein
MSSDRDNDWILTYVFIMIQENLIVLVMNYQLLEIQMRIKVLKRNLLINIKSNINRRKQASSIEIL